jgi:Secretion system C-terminal sorting domain
VNQPTLLKMKIGYFSLLCFLILVPAQNSFSQSAPAHLKYFGFVAIDCFYDDPLDTTAIVDYIAEVDSFSNIAHMCVYDFTDDIVVRTQTMNSHCVNPMLHIQNVFFQYVDTAAPSGANYDLFPNFLNRWITFKNINASVLNATNIGCFYLADEPFWNGMTLNEMNIVTSIVKTDFPAIPILTVEAYGSVNTMQVSPDIDWVGFDRYGEFDPQNNAAFLENLDTLKARLSSPSQRIFLIIDDQWFPEYQTFLGWTQDTMADVVQNYYDLAASDTNIIGLIGYIWPGGLDGPTHHGVRNLTPAVINKNVEIGTMIKANYSPCNTIDISKPGNPSADLKIYPNPSRESLTIEVMDDLHHDFQILDCLGRVLLRGSLKRSQTIDLSSFPAGLYLIKVDEMTARVIKN